MRLLTTPFFQLIVELYRHPLSTNRWEPASWQRQRPDAQELKFLSNECWKLVGVMRDVRVLLEEIGTNEKASLEDYQEGQIFAGMIDATMMMLIDTQIAIELSREGPLKDDPDARFCIRKGGQIIVCTCPPKLKEFLESGTQEEGRGSHSRML